jgi:hypothetical protein
MEKLEKDIEKKLRDAIKKRGGWCLKWVCPGWSGVPDRLVLLPGGRVLFVETKRPKGGRLALLQEWWRVQLRGLGFQAYVVATEAELATLMLIVDDLLGRG